MILNVLVDCPRAGLDEPFYVYLVCYRVLDAAHDPRATAVLQTVYRLLQEYADHITDLALLAPPGKCRNASGLDVRSRRRCRRKRSPAD